MLRIEINNYHGILFHYISSFDKFSVKNFNFIGECLSKRKYDVKGECNEVIPCCRFKKRYAEKIPEENQDIEVVYIANSFEEALNHLIRNSLDFDSMLLMDAGIVEIQKVLRIP